MRQLFVTAKACLLFSFALLGCSSEPDPIDTSSSSSASSSSGAGPALPAEISFSPSGSVSDPKGKASFRFGAASAATQIEDQNPNTDWFLWTQPAPEGLGRGSAFVGEASRGFTLSIEDVQLLADMHLDSYRFSIEWARVEPQRNVIDEAALKHYSELIDALLAKNIRPMITIHHFSNPVWVDDPRDLLCAKGPSDTNLCGLNNPTGGPLVVAELAEFAALLAKRFGDRVDDWCTLNEPVNYLIASYGGGASPPGKIGLGNPTGQFIPAVRNYIDAHAAMYRAIKANDTIDADGDGVAASVGLTKEAQEWVAARDGAPSDNPEDVAARDRFMWVYQYLFVEALRQGSFDANFDGTLDEPHDDWKDTLDWIGVQYYFRAGVTGKEPQVPLINVTPCAGDFDGGACVPALDDSYLVPAMKYEHHPAGLYTVLKDFGVRWPDLPFTVTESGIATLLGTRRAEMIVRALEAIDKARAEGVDVRGYYHWSIYDNFEWDKGFTPQFGLYSVDFTSFKRTPTDGATVLGAIAESRKLTGEQRSKYGGEGPMTPEPLVK